MRQPKWQEDEEEDIRQKRQGGKLSTRGEQKGELVSPQSAKGKSPAAGDERRTKHFGDDVGGTALPIPSKLLNTVSPGTVASNGTAILRPFNTPSVEPLHASHLKGSRMDDVDTVCHSQMDKFEVEQEVGMAVRKWRRTVVRFTIVRVRGCIGFHSTRVQRASSCPHSKWTVNP